MNRENETTEYKLLTSEGKLPDSFLKSAAAFLNTEGGTIYVGIADDGSVQGVSDPDDVQKRISGILRDNIRPEMLNFVRISTECVDEKNIVVVTIQPGTMKPYYISGKGIKPEGVYIRKGSGSLPASESTIKEMLMEMSGRSFEKERSIEQELTFSDLEKEMKSRSLDFGDCQMKTLGLLGRDGLYTNLALLLSDQCPFTIKIAVFEGSDSLVFHDRREIGGSLLHQIDAVLEFIDLNNRTHAQVGPKYREEKKDYPPEAIRELVLNCIVHRDYSFSGSNIINIYSDHIDFISIGSIVPGISMEAIMRGVSQTRNPALAQLFYRLRLVESYGTGIKKVIKLYEGAKEPEFCTAEGGFFVKIYNRNMRVEQGISSDTREEDSTKEQLILDFVKEHGLITRADVERILGIKKGKAYSMLKKLCERGLLLQSAEGRNTTYHQ